MLLKHGLQLFLHAAGWLHSVFPSFSPLGDTGRYCIYHIRKDNRDGWNIAMSGMVEGCRRKTAILSKKDFWIPDSLGHMPGARGEQGIYHENGNLTCECYCRNTTEVIKQYFIHVVSIVFVKYFIYFTVKDIELYEMCYTIKLTWHDRIQPDMLCTH